MMNLMGWSVDCLCRSVAEINCKNETKPNPVRNITQDSQRSIFMKPHKKLLYPQLRIQESMAYRMPTGIQHNSL